MTNSKGKSGLAILNFLVILLALVFAFSYVIYLNETKGFKTANGVCIKCERYAENPGASNSDDIGYFYVSTIEYEVDGNVYHSTVKEKVKKNSHVKVKYNPDEPYKMVLQFNYFSFIEVAIFLSSPYVVFFLPRKILRNYEEKNEKEDKDKDNPIQ